MQTDDFDFDLPRELIAERPVRPRDAARLLHVPVDGSLDDRIVRDLPAMLRPGDIMVFNDTRVIPARLYGRRGGARIEVTLHKPAAEDAVQWWSFARPARKLRPGDTVTFGETLRAEVTERGEGGEVALRFDCAPEDLMAALDRVGVMPLPPYIAGARPPDAQDREDYQTVYAEQAGSVAAPTAGLHFTPALLERLSGRGIYKASVTLHVGAGTFLPVKTEDPLAHKMHSESGEIDAETARTINDARNAGGRVIAVGTTALRLLESAADETGHLHPFARETDIFILPGYRFRIADMLLTNFHLPRSTLFMLVSAFAGTHRMHRAYAHAKARGYRFYSYGDASLLEQAEQAESAA